jgi:hypothetical protein
MRNLTRQVTALTQVGLLKHLDLANQVGGMLACHARGLAMAPAFGAMAGAALCDAGFRHAVAKDQFAPRVRRFGFCLHGPLF